MHCRRATAACIIVFLAVTAWTIGTADGRWDAPVSTLVVGLPILAVVLGALWLVQRSRMARRPR